MKSVLPRLEDYRHKYSHMEFERRDGILQVTLHTNGDSLQWGFGPHEEMTFMLADIGADPDNKLIILTGTGENFIGALEADFFMDDGEPKDTGVFAARDWGKLILETKRMVMNHLDMEPPVIAAVNGPALFHSEMALMADIVLAAEEAEFQDKPHFFQGRVPGDGVNIVYPMLLGLNRARYFLLTGQKIDAQSALDLGLVSEVLPREQLLPRAWELAAEILKRPPDVVRYTRSAMLQGLRRAMYTDMGWGAALECLAGADDGRETFYQLGWQRA